MNWKIYRFLDNLYHNTGEILPLRWACDRYDDALLESSEPPPYALRCPVCEGLDYPGLNHNPISPECILHMGAAHHGR